MPALSTPRLAALAALTLACGGSATAKLKLRNDTPAGLAAAVHGAALRLAAAPALATSSPVAPSLVGIKLIAVYLAEDVDPATQDNVGRTSMIWLNAQCEDDISACNVSGAAGSYAHRVTDYFDFARGTEAVNAALNSQGRAVDPGTYRYVRMEFCKLDPGTALTEPNFSWQAPPMAEPRSFSVGMCGVTSKPFATPLVLKAGDAASVTVAYDLTTTVVTGAAGTGSGGACFVTGADQVCYMDCVDDAVGGTRTCFNPPEFTPSAAAGL